MPRRIALLLLVTTSLLAAANLGRYRDWPDSPQGYS